MTPLAFILFGSIYFTPIGIFLNQNFNELSRNEFENFLTGSSIHFVAKYDAAMPTET